MMLLLMRAMISSTTVISFGWLGAGAALAGGGGTDPDGSADWPCWPTNQGAPKRNVNRITADFFISNLKQGRATSCGISTESHEYPPLYCILIQRRPLYEPSLRAACPAACDAWTGEKSSRYQS